MKKLFCALVCLIAAFSLIACGSSIGAPKNVRIENEFLKWDSVDKATGYVVKVNSTEIETAFLSTEVALSDESVASKLIEGSNTFYVKALAKKGSSGFSDGVEYIHTTVPETQKLPAPSLSFDTVQKNKVVWAAVAHADGYRVRINGAAVPGTQTETAYTVTKTEVGSYKIAVMAVGSGLYTPSDYSTEITYTVSAPAEPVELSQVTGLAVSGNILTWTPVANAAAYNVKCGSDAPERVTEATYSISITEPGLYNFSVQALGDGVDFLDGAYSSAIEYTVAQPDAEKLTAPVLTLTGNVVSWEAVENAVRYELKINSEATVTVAASATPSFAVVKDTYGDYSVTVKAIGDGVAYETSDASAPVVYTIEAVKLDSPVITADSRANLSWPTVERAVGYKIFIGGIYKETTTSTTYTLSEDAGTYSVTVIAAAPVGDKVYIDSEPSLAAEVVIPDAQKLAAPVLVLTGNVVSWESVDGAVGYQLSVNGGAFIALGAEVLTYTIEKTEFGDYTVTVKAVGDNFNNLTSDASQPIVYTIDPIKLAAPVVTVDQAKISWTAVERAVAYKIYIGGELVDTVTELFYNLENGAGTYSVTVVAAVTVGDKIYSDSEPSIAKDVVIPDAQKLTAPVIKLEGNVVSWEPVVGAVGYLLTIKGETIELTSDVLAYTIEKAEFGEYVVTVKAVGDDFNNLTSDASNAVTYTKFAEKLAAPVVTVNGKVLSWAKVEHAAGYKIFIGGVYKQTVSALTYTVTEATGKYSLTVQAIVAEGDKVYADSEQSVAADVLVTAILTAPANVKVEGKVVTWDAVLNAGGYYIMINNVKDPNKIVGTSYTYTGTAVGIYPVRVMAAGTDDGVYLESGYSAEVSLVVTATLTVPGNIEVSGTVVTWDKVPNATKYKVQINDEAAIEVTGLTYTLTKPAGFVYQVKIKAVGNGTTYLDSAYSTAVGVTISATLAAPKNTRVNNKTVTWDAVPNAVSYKILVGETEYSVPSGTSYTLAETAGGVYSVKVMAVGNGGTHLDGPYGTAVDVTVSERLAAPELTLTEDVVSWEAAANAIAYRVYIDGAVVIESTTDLTYTVTQTENGTYSITVMALGNGTTFTDSAQSVAVKYIVSDPVDPGKTKLTAPVLTSEGITVTWEAVENATGYSVSVNNVTVSEKQTETSHTLIDILAVTYTIKVKALGDVVGEEGTFVDSDDAATSITVAKRATPVITNVDGFFNWVAEGATAYKWAFYLTAEEPVYQTNADKQIALPTNAGVYKLSVFAIGGEALILDSAEAAYTYTVLGVPANLRISGKTIQWNSVAGALTYKLTVDGAERSMTATSYTLTAGGKYAVTVQAIGNETTIASGAKSAEAELIYNGAGTTIDPYLIFTAADMNTVKTNLTFTYSLQNDVTVPNNYSVTTSSVNVFNGVFNGNNYTISGVTSQFGLFGYTTGSIKNLVVDVNINAPSAVYAGGVAVKNWQTKNGSMITGVGKIENVTVNGTINAKGGPSGDGVGIGGIVSENHGYIANCVNNAKITAESVVGGIASLNQNGEINSCINNGAITATGYRVGGIAANNQDATIANCINTGDVGTAYDVGGIVGKNGLEKQLSGGSGYLNASVWNCLNTGAIKATGGKGAGIAGMNYGWEPDAPNGGWGGVKNCVTTGKLTLTTSAENPSGAVVGDQKNAGGTNYYLAGSCNVAAGSNATSFADTAAGYASIYSSLNAFSKDVWYYEPNTKTLTLKWNSGV